MVHIVPAGHAGQVGAEEPHCLQRLKREREGEKPASDAKARGSMGSRSMVGVSTRRPVNGTKECADEQKQKRQHKEKRVWEAQSASSRERRKARSSKRPNRRGSGLKAETSVGDVDIGGIAKRKGPIKDSGRSSSSVESRRVEMGHEPRESRSEEKGWMRRERMKERTRGKGGDSHGGRPKRDPLGR